MVLVPSAVALTAAPIKVLGVKPVDPKLVNTSPVAVAVFKSRNAKCVGLAPFIAKNIKLLLEPLAESLEVKVNPPVVMPETVCVYGPALVEVEYVTNADGAFTDIQSIGSAPFS